jgi:hypothetical protein
LYSSEQQTDRPFYFGQGVIIGERFNTGGAPAGYK